MKGVLFALCLALLLAGPACAARPTPPPVTAPDAVTSDTTPTYASVDAAVRALVDRAAAGDTEYYRPLVFERRDDYARDMIARVNGSEMLEYYGALSEDSSRGVQLNFHSRGNFQVELERAGDAWVVRRVWPCK